MIRAACMALLGLVLASCAPAATSAPPVRETPAGSQAEEEAAVLAAMDQYINTLTSGAVEQMRTETVDNGLTFRASAVQGGGWDVVARPNSYWLDPAQDPQAAYRARYWSPTVLVRGPIAAVWTPYEFWLNGESQHCGVELISFVKMDGAWKVSNATWTVEPNACEALRPADESGLRPAE